MKFCHTLLMLALTGMAVAQAAPQQNAAPRPAPTITFIIERSLSNSEREVVPAADAMPEDKLNFAPTNGEFKGVKTFAQQVKHIAATDYDIAAAILGEKSPVETGEFGPDNITSKADVMKYLKGSFEYSHKAFKSITAENQFEMVQSPFGPNKVPKLALAISMLSHTPDHYGQMVEYLRMNGIVPPASAGQPGAPPPPAAKK
jgi:uncharacterized damage-inducible protein DinB